MHTDLILGIDIGSVFIKTAVLDAHAGLLAESYTRIKGDPLSSLEHELSALISAFSQDAIRAAGITGSGGKLAADLVGAQFVNEILAQSRFAATLHPATRTIIEMGGEDSKLIQLGRDPATGSVTIEDFSMNTACAAGTGSFLDQQASRLHLTIEAFSRIALKSLSPPRIAGRCSVFAKSDMIHLQQIATPDYDIVAGLCFAMVRNFKATVGKGKKIHAPILFLGGVAANLGMRRAMTEVLRLDPLSLVVPDHFATSGAIGAALVALDQRTPAAPYRGLAGLRGRTAAAHKRVRAGVSMLSMPNGVMQNPDRDSATEASEPVEAYLGVDVGSVSTNVVVIDAQGRVLSKRYLPTAGRPIEAVKQGLAEVGDEIGGTVVIVGVGTTGSGRYLTGDMIGADVIRNEITAQATAAIAIDPQVDTIFEIGGQDSKFISVRNGAVVDFEMNKACAAGTGSFLEEQAERLGIHIRREFETRAFQAPSPCSLGERCTVFMESDLVHSMNTGENVDSLTAGLAYSIAYNYLNKVVAAKKIGDRIFFQGGVAANKAVVSAFEIITNKTVTVPPHHEVTGAVGAALLAQRERRDRPSQFKGFDLSKRSYSVRTFECAECANRCSIRKVNFEGEHPLYYGSRCEKYEVKRAAASPVDLADLFAERERLLLVNDAPIDSAAPIMGIPRALFLQDFLPYWQAFFTALGYRVLLSDSTNRTLINKGLEAAVAETCFPARVALGHIQDLIDRRVDILFLPSFIQLPAAVERVSGTQACPYVQSLPYVARASLDLDTVRTLEPILYLQDQRHRDQSMQAIGAALGRSAHRVGIAQRKAESAQRAFVKSLDNRGKEVLAELAVGEKAFVLIGRGYNTCDAGLNMNLPAKIRDLGIRAIPMDLLPLQDVDMTGWEAMYWRSGQRILAAARFIKDHSNLYPVYITNFGCGPDSFITHFFREEMDSKPFLQLEIDEHSADAGAITRIEAFLDSVNYGGQQAAPKTVRPMRKMDLEKRTVYVPFMADHAHALAASFRSCNVDAVVLPASDSDTQRIGKEFSSGRECYPLMLTVGDMVRAARNPSFDPGRSAFFMPSGKGPCRFGQYQRYHRSVMDSIGMHDVPIFAPMQDETLHRDVRGLDRNFVRMCWQGTLAVDMLEKALRETRPYELQTGQADVVYEASLSRLITAIENRADLADILGQAYADFMAIGITERNKPVVGIVGEIFIRSNRFSNEGIVRQIEDLGGEAWVAPISEWLLYLTETSKASARMKRSWKALLTAHITGWAQHRDETRFLSRFNGTLRSLHEPTIAQSLHLAGPYIHRSYEGEAVLSVGKTIDFIRKGVSGIISVMPLSCMPGTIATAVLKRVREAHPAIPFLNIAYEGQQDSQTLTRLEAFMHQARSCKQRI